jgi:WD40 repeat protein/serine/threonine protein kinase/tetratricopeptide (TPR) repeat protein
MSDATADRDPIEVLADSFLARFRRGERPSVEDYAGKYPDLADEIRELLPALVLLEQGKSAAGEPTGSVGAASPIARAAAPQLGDYLILREVGRGGMGVVYEAVQQSLGRHVALKVLPAAGPTGSALERFRLEARSAARLHHTNIVPVFGVGEDDGVAFYAMQFIRGQGLDVVIDELRRRRDRGGQPPAGPGGPGAAGTLADALTLGFTDSPAEPAADAMRAPRAAGPEETAPIAPAEPESTDVPAQAPSLGTGLASELSAAPTGSHYHRGVARLGLQVAEALAYAHGQGILHRDIKPSNLLLDSRGTAWVTDFGLAKAEGSDGPTRTGDVVGTLRYMAPERFDGRSDPRSDIYGLGATLYELLTLRPPFEDTDRVRLIDRVLRGTPERPRKFDARIPRDLETVVLKALARDPADRYPTAEAMAEDLCRFLADRPVLARRATATEQVVRWCRRNPALAAASALAFAGLAAAVAILGVSNARIRERSEALRLALFEKDGALRGRTLALGEKERALAEARREEQRANRNAALAEGQERLARTQERLARLRFYASQVNLAGQALESGDLARALTLLENQRPRPGEEDLRTFEWYHLGSRVNAAIVRELRVQGPSTLSLAPAPDGRTLAVAEADGPHLWDLATGEEVRRLPTAPAWCWCVAWSPDGRRIATGDGDGRLKLWDPATGRQEAEFRMNPAVRAIAWSPDGRHLAAGSDGPDASTGRIMVLDPSDGSVMADFTDHRAPVSALGFSPDGRALASGAGWGGDEGSVSLWDWRAGRRLWHRDRTQARGPLTFTADGRRLVGAHSWVRNSVLLIDAADGRTVAEFDGHRSGIAGVASTPDGHILVSVGQDRTVRAWDVATGRGRIVGAQAAQISTVAIAPDGRTVITGDGSGAVRLWDLRAEPGQGRYDAMPVRGIGFAPDGRGLVAGGAGPTRLLDPATLAERGLLPAADAFDVAPRGDRLAVRDGHRTLLRIIDAQAGRGLGSVDLGRSDSGEGGYFRFAPDGRMAVTFCPFADRRVRVWDLDAGQLRETIEPPDVVSVLEVAFAPDGGGLAVGCQFHDVAVYRFATRSWHRRNVASGSPLVMVRSVAYAPDGRTLAAALESGSILLLDAESLAVRARLEGHGAPAVGLAFSPDGRTVASASEDGTIRLWDPETGQERLSLPCARLATRLAFSPDGLALFNWGWETPLWIRRAARDPLAAARRPVDKALDPESPRELDVAGYGLWLSGRVEEAESAFRQALARRDPGTGAGPTGTRIRAMLALLLDEAGRRGEASELRRAAADEARGLTRDARHELALGLLERAGVLRGRGKRAPAEAARDLAAEVAPEDDADVLLALANCEAESGLWARAAGRFEASTSLLTADANRAAVDAARAGYLGALARLAAGDAEDHRGDRARLLDRFADSSDAGALFWATWACALGPGRPADARRLSAAAHRLTGLRPADPDAFQTAGAALYRAGRPVEAARWLDEALVARSVEGAPQSTPLYGRLFLAMAIHRLGHPREARARLAEAVTAIDSAPESTAVSTPWNRRLTLRLLRSEAEATLARPAGDAPTDELAAAGPQGYRTIDAGIPCMTCSK